MIGGGKYAHLKGLPYSATNDDVCNFLGNDVNVLYVHIHNNLGGEAYVHLASSEDLQKALYRNESILGKRFIRVHAVANQTKIDKVVEAINSRRTRGILPAIRMRGIPFGCTEQTIRDFFKGLNVEEVVVGRDPKVIERFTGEAYVRFSSPEDVSRALGFFNRKYIGLRYVEIVPTDGFLEYKDRMSTLFTPRPRTPVQVVEDSDLIEFIDLQNEEDDYVEHNVENYEEQNEVEDFDEIEEVDDNEEEDDLTNSEDEKPELIRELLEENRAFSEKMALIGREIYRTAMTKAHRGGYKDSLNDLDKELFDYAGVNGSELAKMVGYPSFQAMCLNAPEIVEHFTWTRKLKKCCGRVTYEIHNFCPIISGRQKILYEIQRAGLRETCNNPIEKFIIEYRNKGEFPDDQELDFRLRLCDTLNACNGMKVAIHHSVVLAEHKKRHGEQLNSETYRKVFPYKTRVDIQRIITERMRMEIALRPTVSRRNDSQHDPNGQPDNLEFKLRQPPEFISRVYESLRQARDEYAELMARPQIRSDDDGDYGSIRLRFQQN